MVGQRAGKTARPSASCNECQRRKQKCSRQWPCNHCQARKIPHMCSYAHKRASKTSPSSAEASGKTSSDEEAKDFVSVENNATTAELPALTTNNELRDIGYLPNEQNLLFQNTVSNSLMPPASSNTMTAEMKNALRLLPPKPYTDTLVQHFLENTNYNYYSIHPPTFSQDYTAWWSDRANGKPLTPELTCLVLRICALSGLYLDIETRRKLESELGEPVQSLSESYHHAAKQLSITISPGKGGLTHVQQLFLMAAWFKSEGLFIESWHALSSCIHEAQELGMHKSSPNGLSEFDLEMRRRVWCLLYVWDWQMALLLSRPLIINQSYYSFELPNMQLESLDVEGPPSPVAHIAAQLALGEIITKVPGAIGGTIDTSHAEDVRTEIQNWLACLPSAYRTPNPDTQWDEGYPYVALHRRQMHVVGYMIMLLPFKASLVKSFDSNTPTKEQEHRRTGVDVSLELINVSHQLFDHVFPVNAKFHLVTFVLLDTAAFLCSAVIHDKHGSLPRCEEVIQAIGLACLLMKQLAEVTKTGAACYPVLMRLANSLPRYLKQTNQLDDARPGLIDAERDISGAPNSEVFSFNDAILTDSLSNLNSSSSGVFMPASFDYSIPGMETADSMEVSEFPNIDVGQMDQIWDWQDLDLTLLPNVPVAMETP